MSARVHTAPSLDEARRRLAARLRLRFTEAEEAVLTHQLAMVPHHGGEPSAQFVQEARQLVGECLECALVAIEQGGEWSAPVPPVVVLHARRAVHNGVPLGAHLQRYIVGYKVAWDFVLEETALCEVPEVVKLTLLREASAAYTSLLARLVAEAVAAHSGETRRNARTRAERRTELVDRLLGGGVVSHADLGHLGYDLDVEHLGVIASGAGADRAMEVLGERLGCRVLSVPSGDGMLWAWFGASGRLRGAECEIEALLPNGRYQGVTVAVGRAAPRIEGFRLTHRLARAAALVAEHKPTRVTCYGDVALEASALQDHLLAGSLTSVYISPLEEDRHGITLLQTLRAFYEARRNIATTAASLRVGRHTVARRLHRIEELIARQLDSCHAEIEVALRLVALRDAVRDRSEPQARP